MQNGDDAFPSISLAGIGQLVKILIPLFTEWYILINFAYVFTLILSSHWYAQR